MTYKIVGEVIVLNVNWEYPFASKEVVWNSDFTFVIFYWQIRCKHLYSIDDIKTLIPSQNRPHQQMKLM